MTDVLDEPRSELSFRITDDPDLFIRNLKALRIEREFTAANGRRIARRGYWVPMTPEVADDDEYVLAVVGSEGADRALRPWRYPDPPAVRHVRLWHAVERLEQWARRRR